MLSIRPKGIALAALLAGSVFASSAAAQDKPACDKFDWPVNRELVLFAAQDLKRVSSGANLDSLPVRGLAFELLPHDAVKFVIAPERQPKTGASSGGVLTATVSKAGAYQVTLSAEAWVDVIQNGNALRASAHTGKRDCQGVRKSVRFDLQAGLLTIQLSGAGTNIVNLAVLPVE